MKISFTSAKNILSKRILLYHPRMDAITRITVDASDIAIGAALEQVIEGDVNPLAFSQEN